MIKVKICGLRTLADVNAVNEYKPDFAGFIFAHTKRFVTDEQAQVMKKALEKEIKTVGVFVNEPQEHILSLCKKGIINYIQLHGDEDETYLHQLKQQTDTPVIKVIRVKTKEQVMQEMYEEADYYLFDTYTKDSYGGTGKQLPLFIIEEIDIKKPFFIAGGLNESNVSEVIGKLPCYGVDVSSGVERDGFKDRDKIQEFINQARK